jgi:hypothetical protein
MRNLPLSVSYYIVSDAEGVYRSGSIFHIARNSRGGSTSTPVGMYFSWRPDVAAFDQRPHWRIDCFVRDHKLAPAADWLGRALADALIGSSAVSEPLWVSWHSSNELGGEPRGRLFEDD